MADRARRVLDCSSGIAGAYCARLLGAAGADVVLAEPPGGAPLRRWSTRGDLPAGTDGALFRYLHHGHRSVVPADAAEAERWFAGADVVVTDRTGWCADPAALADRHPHLVVVAITPYGLTGPYADRPASELTIQAESGGLAIRGLPDRPPFQAGGQVTDWVTGTYAAVAAAAVLRRTAAGGPGELVDVSWLEVANLTCANFADLFDSLRGRPSLDGIPPRALETPSIEPTRDGYVGFNTNTRQQFEDFLVLIDRPDLLADPDLPRLQVRQQRWREWNDIVSAWTRDRTTAEIVEAAAVLRIPSAPVADAPTLLASEHAVARGVFVDDPSGQFSCPRVPWQIDDAPAPPPSPAPRLGADTGVPPWEARPAPTGTGTDLPLTGIKVLDLTAWWAGPSATGVLAALGADVVHVESVSRMDGMRATGGLFADQPAWWERSAFFLQANAGKRDLTLDLADPRGRELLLALAADADLVVENYTPRVLESFRLDWDALHAANERLVLVRMPAFGLDGPWRDRPGFAQTMEQMTGLAWLTGHVDDQPRIQRGPCDPNGGMHAAFAALVALERRETTGRGCLVEAPMFEAAVAIAAEAVLEWTAYGELLSRDGNRSPRAAPQGLYPCRGHDRWVAVSVLDDGQWVALVDALGRPAWADESTATAAGRRAAHDAIDAHLAAWTADREVADVVATLAAAGVPVGDTRDPRRVSSHPQLTARGFFEPVAHEVVGTHPTPTVPFRLRSVPCWVRRPAPLFGQHNAEVLATVGVDARRLDELTSDGVVGDRPAGL